MSENERLAQQVEWLKGLSMGYERELNSLIELPTSNDKLTKVEDLTDRYWRN